MTKSLKYLIIFLISLPLLCVSQEDSRSAIYNYKGQLRIDTSLTIGYEQYRVWSNIEHNILNHLYKHVVYPTLAIESRQTGIVIISFYCDTLEIKNVRLIEKNTELLNNATIEGFTKIKEKLIYEFRAILSSHHGQKYTYIGNYYLPIKFDLIDLNKQMTEDYIMPIIGTKISGISRFIE